MDESVSVLLPVSKGDDAWDAAVSAYRTAVRLGFERQGRVRVAAAALHAASVASEGVRLEYGGDPDGSLRLSAVPEVAEANYVFAAPGSISPARIGSQSEAEELRAFAGDVMEILQSVAELNEELRNSRSVAEGLESELEETNRGVLALYAELDDRADKLRRADELKSRFLSYASHELRTPLNGIIGLVRLLCEGKVHHDPEERKQLAFIQQAAEEMREMVNDLLDLAKVEAGKLTVQPSEFGLEFVFGALRGIFRPLLQTGNVVLRFEDTSAVPAIYSDEAKVSQILRNFISNALKFTEDGEVRVWAEANGGLIQIAVQDTGIGIAPENLGRIFEEYTQVEHPLQRRARGTGLGLPLCKRLAMLLGGHVEVHSELGKGSTFTLVLPQKYAAGLPTPAEPVKVRSPRRGHPTLLIIEDAEIDRYLLKQLLIAGGEYNIVEAEDGKSGLEWALRQAPDLIFLDLTLPKLDGFSVLSGLRSNPATSSVPVAVVTARSLSDEEFAELEANTTAIFDKEGLAQTRKLEIDFGPPARITRVS